MKTTLDREASFIREMRSKDSRILLFSDKSGITVLFLENGRITDVWKEKEHSVRAGDIYLGRISRYSSNIEAYYIEILKGVKCFLPANKTDFLPQRDGKPGKLHEGDPILVQIKKEAYKTKLAFATTELELSGKYSVIGNGSSDISYSKKINVQDRNRLELLLRENCPEAGKKFHVLLRTAAAECMDESLIIQEIRENEKALLQIIAAASHTYPLCKMHGTASLLEMLFTERKIGENTKIITKDKALYDKITGLCWQYGLDPGDKAVLYPQDELPFSVLYNLKSRFSEITNEKVWLPSGGSLYIAPTEALVVIDVNTGKIAAKGTREDTFLKINLEASAEIALQIQARNLSGIILVDFINMKDKNNATILIADLRKRLKRCSPPGEVVDITKLGLIEITREKKRPDIYEIKDELNKTILM